MLLSVTEIMNFLRCRRKWDYGSFNRQSLTPVVGRPHFVLGTAIHQSLAAWMEHPNESLVSLYNERAVALLASLISEYEQRMGMRPSSQDLQALSETLTLGVSMMSNYQNYYTVPLQAQLIQPEQAVSVAIPGTEHSLEATFDGLARAADDTILIVEHKTYNSRPRVDVLQNNFQFIAYVWAAHQLGFKKVALAYDGLWKRAEPPAGKTIEDLFLRLLIRFTPAELQEFETELIAISNAMVDPIIYKTVPWNGCWDCEFVELCTAQTKRQNLSYVRNARYMLRERTSIFALESD